MTAKAANPAHVLVPKELLPQLRANWPDQSGSNPPVLKIFNPAGAATRLIYAVDPHDDDTLFGLADLGLNAPELGYISLAELDEIRVNVRVRNPRTGAVLTGPPIPQERDLYFRPNGSLQQYADAAQLHRRIVDHVTRKLPDQSWDQS